MRRAIDRSVNIIVGDVVASAFRTRVAEGSAERTGPTFAIADDHLFPPRYANQVFSQKGTS